MQSKIIFLVIVFILVVVVVYILLQRNNSKKEAVQISKNIYDDQVNNKLKKIEQKFMDEAVGFYIQEKTFELNMDKESKESLYAKVGYKEVYSTPVIEWSKEFDFMKSHIDERDRLISVYLKNSAGDDFCKYGEFVLVCFERYVLFKAKEAADRLV